MISDQKQNDLQRRMQSLGIKESDFEETFIKARGSGGQKLNKTSSCVRLKHIPSGIEVRCEKTRSQADNRFLAKRMIVEELELKLLGKKSKQNKKIEKLKKQKAKRKKRTKCKLEKKE